MAEEPTNPFASVLNALKSKPGNIKKRGVRKDGGNVSPNLSSPEVARYKKIFSIMKDVVNPEVEAKRLKTSKRGAIGKTAQMQASASKTGKGGGFEMPGIGAMIAGAGLFIGLVTAAWTQLGDDVKAKFEGIAGAIGEFGGEVLESIGHLPLMAAKLAKMIPIKRLKMLPFIGSLLNFAFAAKAFKEGNIGVGIWEVVSGVAGLFPGVGSFISAGMDMIMWMYESNNPEDETGKRNMGFGEWIGSKVKDIGGKIWQAIVDGKVPLLSGLFRFGEGIGLFIQGDFAGGMQKWMEVLPAMLGQGANPEFMQAFEAFTFMLAEGGAEMATIAVTKAGNALSWLDDIFIELGNIVGEMFTAVKEWVSGAVDRGFDKLKGAAGDAVDSTWNAVAGLNPFGKKYEDGGVVPGTSYTGDKVVANVNSGEMILNQQQQANLFKQANQPQGVSRSIDKLLDANSTVMSALATVNKNQLDVLVSIRNGINTLVSNIPSGDTPVAATGPTEVNSTVNPLTQQFYA